MADRHAAEQQMKCDEKTSFIYVGDPQCSRISGKYPEYSQWCNLVGKAMDCIACEEGEEKKAQLLIIGGDIVNRGNRTEEWEAFFRSCDGLKRDKKIVMATPVNGARESVGRYGERFLNTGNGPAGYEKNFFSFEYGCCHFIVLDSDYMGNTDRKASRFIGNWIKEDLSASDKPVAFAVMHHPMYALGTSFEDEVRARAMRDNYQKLLYRYGVDFILCGHQHAYCRTREMDDPAITQIMGISGTKYFDAWNCEAMEICRENVSVATVFETDGRRITLKTIDNNGSTIDFFEKNVRRAKKRNCLSCDKYSICRGSGQHKKGDAEPETSEERNPLKPAHDNGIEVIWDDRRKAVLVKEEQIRELEKMEVEYSVMRKGSLSYEKHAGVRLDSILKAAGYETRDTEGDLADESALILTAGNGRQRILKAEQAFNGVRYRQTAEGEILAGVEIPAILFEENGVYRFAGGQNYPGQYNGRYWERDIRRIEIRRIK